MAEACAALLGGGTISGVMREWARLELAPPQRDRRGTTRWSRASIRSILLNPRIAGLSGRSRRRNSRRPAPRRPGRRSPRRRRTTVRRRTPGTARTPAPGPARQHRRPARKTVFPPVTPASDTRTARPGSRQTATTATAAATEATRPCPLTMRARTAQRIRYGSSARMLPDARREHLATPGERRLLHARPLRRLLSGAHAAAGTLSVAAPTGVWPPPAHVTDGDVGQEVAREIRLAASGSRPTCRLSVPNG